MGLAWGSEAMLRRIRHPLISAIFTVAGLVSIGTTLGASSREAPIQFTSMPPGLTVHVDGEVRGVTPLVLDLDCAKDHRVRVDREGYVSSETVIHSTLRWSFLGSGLLGGPFLGPIQWGAGLWKGSAKDLEPRAVHVDADAWRCVGIPMGPEAPR